jgi:chemotaxis protein methyltransferase WspC
MTPLAAVAARLRVRLGLDPEALGGRALAHAVRARARARGVDAADYAAVLDRDAVELQALIDAVVVPETWFFRDVAPFVHLADWAARTWDRTTPLTVLSLPCATGEEAWSIAIALAAAGIPVGALRIEARDVSARALAAARAGVYARRALRGRGLPREWARYLAERPDGTLEVDAALRPAVHFAEGNLVAAATDFAGRRFDVVCSRNLLIYCDAATRAAALETFAAIVRPGGLLVLGHAEHVPPRGGAFVREGPPAAFTWRRVIQRGAPAAVPGPRAERAGEIASRHVPQLRAAAAARPGTAAGAPRSAPALAIDAGAGSSAAAGATGATPSARALADAGRLDDAAALAEQQVARAPADADAHALLGVVYAAQGRDGDAAHSLRRALYLDPQHEEALTHLAIVLERRGERSAAARLRTRARAAGARR